MEGPQKSARQVVATAVQDLVATRLGRGFVPLAVLFFVGIAEQFLGDGFHAPMISLGALGAAVAMLAYGLRISQRAFDRPQRAWMSWAMVGSVVPPLFALYVLAWRGLRVIAGGGGATAVSVGIAFAAVGTWAMRTWMKLVEVERLAQVMTIDLEG